MSVVHTLSNFAFEYLRNKCEDIQDVDKNTRIQLVVPCVVHIETFTDGKALEEVRHLREKRHQLALPVSVVLCCL